MLAEAAAAGDSCGGWASCTVRLRGSSAATVGVAVRERLAGDRGLAGFQAAQQPCDVASGFREGSASWSAGVSAVLTLRSGLFSLPPAGRCACWVSSWSMVEL